MHPVASLCVRIAAPYRGSSLFLASRKRRNGQYHREQLMATAPDPGAYLRAVAPLEVASAVPPLVPASLLVGSPLLEGSRVLVLRNLCPALRRISRCLG
jgi:hypothetical protein